MSELYGQGTIFRKAKSFSGTDYILNEKSITKTSSISGFN
jgi:hypothetical protein